MRGQPGTLFPEPAMKTKILVYYPLPDDLLARLAERFTVTCFSDAPDEAGRATLDKALAEAEGVILSPFPRLAADGELLAKAPKLRTVSTVSVGYDHCDVAALTERKITLTHTPSELTETTADTAFALVLATARRVVELGGMVKAGQWQTTLTSASFGIDVHHKTMGIIGMGRIGSAIARRARGFGMPIVYSGPSRKPEAEREFNARYLPLDDLLATADFVCLSLLASERTRNLIGRAELARMKSSAVLVNISRGFVVDEEALADALRDRTIHAAGLDVFTTEPLPGASPLLGLDNVVLLPHIGSATHETRYNMMVRAVDNLIAALDGTLQENCVNRELLG